MKIKILSKIKRSIELHTSSTSFEDDIYVLSIIGS